MAHYGEYIIDYSMFVLVRARYGYSIKYICEKTKMKRQTYYSIKNKKTIRAETYNNIKNFVDDIKGIKIEEYTRKI